MKKEYIMIDYMPAILWNEPSTSIYIYVHGKGGNKESASILAKAVQSKNIQVISFDLPESGERKNSKERLDVFEGIKDLEKIYRYVSSRYQHIYLCANSLGAYFALQTYFNKNIERCLFYSPVVDMAYLVGQMMLWFNVSLERLKKEKEIDTPVDPLRIDYYEYIINHSVVEWKIPTYILYGELDNLQTFYVIQKFTDRFHVNLTIAKGCEHAMLKENEIKIVKEWLKEYA